MTNDIIPPYFIVSKEDMLADAIAILHTCSFLTLEIV